MTGALAQQFAQVRDALDETCPHQYAGDCDLPEHQTARDGHDALSVIERHVQDMRAEVDRQLGRHLCYTSESARERFWRAVDAALPAREKGTE